MSENLTLEEYTIRFKQRIIDELINTTDLNIKEATEIAVDEFTSMGSYFMDDRYPNNPEENADMCMSYWE